LAKIHSAIVFDSDITSPHFFEAQHRKNGGKQQQMRAA